MKGIRKRGILVALSVMLIAWNCVIVYAGDAWCEYDGNAKGYVRTFMTESGWGRHEANAWAQLVGSDREFIANKTCGYQFGGDAKWGSVGYNSVNKDDKYKYGDHKLGYFTYANAWLQVSGDEYIDSPVGK